MPFYVYILQSESSGRYYCGLTQNLPTRLSQHNDPTNDLAKTTKRFQGPWRLVWSAKTDNASEAVNLERKIKRRGIKRFLHAATWLLIPPKAGL